MAGGKAIRRRAKLMEKANQGNLHKAAKGRASAHLPLPPAPSKEDYTEKLPASLARMMALKDAMSRPSKKQKLGSEANKQQSIKQPAVPCAQHQQQPAIEMSKQNTGASEIDPGSAGQAGSKQAGLLWEQPKKLKQRRKEYLNAKKLKKKAGRRGLSSQEVNIMDKPAFGEVVHEPPKVHLKRKHWDPAAGAAGAALPSAAMKRGSNDIISSRSKHKQRPSKAQRVKAVEHGAKQKSELQELRERVIEGYRAGRGPREGNATLDSLRKLVQ